jgi:hypothetical protein
MVGIPRTIHAKVVKRSSTNRRISKQSEFELDYHQALRQRRVDPPTRLQQNSIVLEALAILVDAILSGMILPTIPTSRNIGPLPMAAPPEMVASRTPARSALLAPPAILDVRTTFLKSSLSAEQEVPDGPVATDVRTTLVASAVDSLRIPFLDFLVPAANIPVVYISKSGRQARTLLQNQPDKSTSSSWRLLDWVCHYFGHSMTLCALGYV